MSKLSNFPWLVALTIAVFVKGCVSPGWASVAELVSCFALLAFQRYFAPRPQEVTDLERKALSDLEHTAETVRALREEIGTLKLQLGFTRRG